MDGDDGKPLHERQKGGVPSKCNVLQRVRIARLIRALLPFCSSVGTTVARLDAFLESYYQTQAAQTADHTASSSRGVNVSTQNLDAPFKEFVWKQLISLPEIKVAVLKRLDPSASTPALALESALETQEDTKESGPDFKAEDSNALDPNANLRNKSLIKAARKDAGKRKRDARISAEQWEFTELSEEELLPATRQSLLDKYGQDDLRLAADPQTAFFALTGSQERVRHMLDRKELTSG